MSLEIKEVTTPKDLKEFVYLPGRLHLGNPIWVPPVYWDECKYFNPKHNIQFNTCSYIRFIATENKRTVGRILGLIHHEYNALRNEKHARFCWMDCHDRFEVAEKLISAVEQWAKSQGMLKLVGPLGFSDKDPQGFQIDGFDYEPANTAVCNPSYLPIHLEKIGFTKEIDLVEYVFDVPEIMPDLHHRVFSRLKNNTDYRLLEFSSKKELKKYIVPIFQLINETYKSIYGFKPMSIQEINDMAKRYFPIVDKEFVKVILKGDKPVAFIIALPNMNSGLRKARGRLLPFGIFHILKSARKTKQLDLMLGAVAEPNRGIGLDAMMGIAIFESAIKRGFKIIDSHLTMETNYLFRAEMERMQGKLVKRFRIYQKSIQ